MSRITPVDPQQADEKTAATLQAVQKKLGILPNIFTVFANAPAALNGYLQLSEALTQGELNARQREMIALAVAQENGCEYCLSAHAAIGKGAGLSDVDIESAQHGRASDSIDSSILEFALKVTRSRGTISDEEFAEAAAQGVTQSLMIEIISQVSLNVLTNYVNRIAGTQVDFPLLRLSDAA